MNTGKNCGRDGAGNILPISEGEGFCIECGFVIKTFDNLVNCPSCGTENTPCLFTEQVRVLINWHELRILSIWAENWQRTRSLGRTIYSITERLEQQFPDKTPLTLAKELGLLAKEYDIQVSDPNLRRDIAEQTGEETGLIGGNNYTKELDNDNY